MHFSEVSKSHGWASSPFQAQVPVYWHVLRLLWTVVETLFSPWACPSWGLLWIIPYPEVFWKQALNGSHQALISRQNYSKPVRDIACCLPFLFPPSSLWPMLVKWPTIRNLHQEVIPQEKYQLVLALTSFSLPWVNNHQKLFSTGRKSSGFHEIQHVVSMQPFQKTSWHNSWLSWQFSQSTKHALSGLLYETVKENVHCQPNRRNQIRTSKTKQQLNHPGRKAVTVCSGGIKPTPAAGVHMLYHQFFTSSDSPAAGTPASSPWAS